MTYKQIAILLSDVDEDGMDYEALWVPQFDKFVYVRAVAVQGVIGKDQEKKLCRHEGERVIHLEVA